MWLNCKHLGYQFFKGINLLLLSVFSLAQMTLFLKNLRLRAKWKGRVSGRRHLPFTFYNTSNALLCPRQTPRTLLTITLPSMATGAEAGPSADSPIALLAEESTWVYVNLICSISSWNYSKIKNIRNLFYIYNKCIKISKKIIKHLYIFFFCILMD